MTFGEKIYKIRTEKQMTQDELAQRVGYKSRSTIAKIESGERDASQSMIVALAQALGTTPSNLMGWDEPAPTNVDEQEEEKDFIFSNSERKTIKKYRTLDEYGKKAVDSILNIEYDRCTSDPDEPEDMIELKHSFYKVSAGTGFNLDDGDSWETIDVPDTPESRKADFALTIKGNSMEPIYYDGDIVLVLAQDAVDVGEIGIFTVNGSGYIKKFGGDRLISLNAEYDDILFEEYDDIRCNGKVIGRI